MQDDSASQPLNFLQSSWGTVTTLSMQDDSASQPLNFLQSSWGDTTKLRFCERGKGGVIGWREERDRGEVGDGWLVVHSTYVRGTIFAIAAAGSRPGRLKANTSSDPWMRRAGAVQVLKEANIRDRKEDDWER